VIVGAGVIGLLTAYELRRRGVEVILVDKGQPGAACSSGNTGWVVPSFSGPLPAPGLVRTSLKWMLSRTSPLYIKPRLDPDLVRWLWGFWRHCNPRDHQSGLDAVAGFGRRTMPLFDALQADGVSFEMHADGVLFAFLDERIQHQVFNELRELQHYGYGVPESLDAKAVHELEPQLSGPVVGGVFVPGERHLHPESLMDALVQRLGGMGVSVRPGTEVTGAELRGGRATGILTSAGRIEGDTFVIAAGAWSAVVSKQFGFTFPLQAGKGYSLTLPNPPIKLRRPIYLEEARVACSPFARSLRLAGTMELSGMDATLDARRIAPMEKAASTYFMGWDNGTARTAWMGMRPVTPDGLPVIGRVPGLGNVFLAAGHAMMGITLAPVTGVAIADLVTGQASDLDLAPFDPARFAR
jgi:D-amino-acid dehydrogenase